MRLPLASGLLTKYTLTKFSPSDHRSYNANGEKFNVGETFAGLPFEKAVEFTDRVRPLLGVDNVSNKIEGVHDPTMADLAMRWILDYDAVTTIIPGASRPAQAAANVRAAQMAPLSGAVHRSLRDLYDREVKQQIRGPY